MLKKFVNCKNRIWGSESYACTIVWEPSGTFRAECGIDSRILNAKNYERVLNDMFYDYCVENASAMGVSWMNEEIRKFANDLGLVIASVWDGYSRKWIVSERDGYFPIFTTSDYDTLIEGLKNGGVFRPL